MGRGCAGPVDEPGAAGPVAASVPPVPATLASPGSRTGSHRAAPPPAAGARLAGRFVLHDRIGGHGSGTGALWRATDLRHRRLVAVRVLGPQHTGEHPLLRLVRERGVRIDHPHVAAPVTWFEAEDLVVLPMELVTGGSLADHLADHSPLPAGEVAVLLDQLLRALAAVHAAGLAHGAVEPRHLLLEAGAEPGPCLRLVGLGHATPRRHGAAVAVDGRVAEDLHSVGLVGMELVTGHPPTRQPAPADLAAHPLRPLLEALLAPDPGERPGSAEEALALLHRLAVPPVRSPAVPDRLGPLPVTGRPDLLGWALVGGCSLLTLAALTFLVLTLVADPGGAGRLTGATTVGP